MPDQNNSGEYTIKWDDKNQIVRVKIIGKLELKEAEAYREEALALVSRLSDQGIKLNRILYDISEAKMPGPATREVIGAVAKEVVEKTGGFKIAYISTDPVQTIIAKILDAFAGNKDAGYFKTEKEAINWLNN
ncbi:STAS/SEC14 domain-containing protein [Patescibacteria group bacterium]